MTTCGTLTGIDVTADNKGEMLFFTHGGFAACFKKIVWCVVENASATSKNDRSKTKQWSVIRGETGKMCGWCCVCRGPRHLKNVNVLHVLIVKKNNLTSDILWKSRGFGLAWPADWRLHAMLPCREHAPATRSKHLILALPPLRAIVS